jgi:heptosyltransferase-2
MHRYLYLASALGAATDPTSPGLSVAAAEIAAAVRRFDLSPATDWIGINPGAEYGPAKRWPAERVIAALRALPPWPGMGFALFGGPAEVTLAAAVADALGHDAARVRNLAGQTSLRELMAALACCRTLLTNDTGPMHVAAALGVPVVALFGSTAPELTGPLPGSGPHALLTGESACAPCFLRSCPIDFRCMTAIPVQAVTAALRARLRAASAPPAR